MRSVVGTPAHPATDDIVETMIASLFAPSPAPSPGRVGLELEFFPVSTAEQPAPVSVRRSRAALSADPGLELEARVSFEPGGQLELSPLPQPSVTVALDQAWRLIDRIRRALARDDLALAVGGMHPWCSADEIGLQVDAPRYRTMQRHFDTLGPAGRRMMRQTAALQVCLDLAPGEAGLDQWRLANLAGPALSAAFANAGRFQGRVGINSCLRIETWQAVDSSRTGFDGFQVLPDPIRQYRDFALAAAVMPLLRPGEASQPPAGSASLSMWRKSGNGRPDVEDLRHHLTTLFPPVRPRGHLEIRYLDALPREHCAVAVIALAALLYDPEARNLALELIACDPPSLASRWRVAAGCGIGDIELRRQAGALLAIAAGAAERMPPGYLPAGAAHLLESFIARYTVAGRSPAHDMSHQLEISEAGGSAWAR